MSPKSDLEGKPIWRFPRVSGDEPDQVAVSSRLRGFSPRERG